MNKLFLVLIGLIFMTTLVIAGDPSITNVDYNQPYVNKPTTFNINIDSNGLEGVVRFTDNGYLITQQTFNPENENIEINYTWNVKETRTIKFYLADLNDVDTNMNNNDFTKNIEIKKGLDLEIKEFTINPTPIPPNTQTTLTAIIENTGDENYLGTIPITFILDGNIICEKTITGIDNNKTITCDWNSGEQIQDTYTFTAHVNRNAMIPELTYINNTKIITSESTPKANLYTKNIEIPNNIRRATITNIPITIGNNGGLNAENFKTSVYLTYKNGEEGKVYEKTINQINADSDYGFNFSNIFDNIGEYTITIKIDEEGTIEEKTLSDNIYSHKISVYDFNADQIYEENDDLRKEIVIIEGRLESCQVQKNTYMQSLVTKENELESCQSNLGICNTNNSTKIANWMEDLDSNQEAMINTMEAKYNNLLKEKETQKQVLLKEKELVTQEKDQWSLLVILILLSIGGYIAFQQYEKGKPKKGVNMTGGFE